MTAPWSTWSPTKSVIRGPVILSRTRIGVCECALVGDRASAHHPRQLSLTLDLTEHFWLNEGWCVFIERKILGRLHGEDIRQFKSILGWKALRESVELFGADNPLTKLQPALEGIDPDDAFSSVPYEKGFAFLYHLESVLGGSAVFEPFMKAYYVHFHNQSVSGKVRSVHMSRERLCTML